MSFGAIHQFHSGTTTGDAITNQMLHLQRRLRSLGYVSDIYAEHIGDGLAELVRPISELVDRPATLLLVHHSMGHTAFEYLERSTLPMVTVFHSITPAHFFDDPVIRHFVRVGFQQLQRLASRSLYGVADSNHNRHQMYDAGFRSVRVLPVRTDFEQLHRARAERTEVSRDWLFVGRVVPNKRQLELVRAFAIHHAAFATAHLHLVGDLSMQGYVDAVRAEIDHHGLRDHVTLHGKVSERQLVERYRDAGVFVCASEHEGFGVPLLEAMAAGIPVVARAEAAVAETLGGAGVLVTTTDPSSTAAIARILEVDDGLRGRVVQRQDERLARIESVDIDAFLLDLAADAAGGGHLPVSVQVQGPFETSYSLAILNRELALHLDTHDDLDVSIWATEGPGDYTPHDSDLAQHPRAAELYRLGGNRHYPDVAIRQMFPPRVDDSTAGLTFQYFGWEESLLPPNIVADFNGHLDGIGVMSSYVADVLRDSGVVVPIAVTGVGVHQPDPAAQVSLPELAELRSTRFLHISSAFPRKGVDVLLRAWFEEFTGADDVTLVLKTFPNPHNEVAAHLEALRSEFADPPHVVWIDRDLDREQIDGLYAVASCYVHAARGEGFGLPVAEAMLARVPVVSVASTGLADFVSSDTADVVGHRLAPAASHVSIPGSMWAEPDRDDLRRALRSMADRTDPHVRDARVEAAARLIGTEFTWDAVGRRWHDFIVTRLAARPGRQIAAVTTYNSRCGIAEYSANMYEAMGEWVHLEVFADRDVAVHDPEVESLVVRAWSNHRQGAIHTLLDALDESAADVVHIQHNMGFFTLPELARIIHHLAPHRPVVVTLHRTVPLEVDGGIESMADIADALHEADAIVVHQEADRERLAAAGVVDNVHLILHGTESSVDIDPLAARRRHGIPAHAYVLGTFGFLLPHKGLLRLLAAVAELRSRCIDVHLVATCALHPDPSSAHHLAEVRAEIERLRIGSAVRLVTDFLEPSVSRDLLACADILVLPYDQTNESASGALRSVLPLGRAMITSRLPIFDDVRDVVRTVPSPVDPIELADQLEHLWLQPDEREQIAAQVRAFAEQTSWANVARRTTQLYADLVNARAADEPPAAAS